VEAVLAVLDIFMLARYLMVVLAAAEVLEQV
jgi:hypothetical protein